MKNIIASWGRILPGEGLGKTLIKSIVYSKEKKIDKKRLKSNGATFDSHGEMLKGGGFRV